MAIQIMANTNKETVPKPPPIKFVSIKCLRNGGTVYKVNTNKAATWIGQLKNLKAFINSYDVMASTRPNGYVIIAENVPLYFDPENTFAKYKVANTNDIQDTKILEMQFMKPSSQQKEGQRTGHILLKLRTRETANKLIAYGTVMEH